MMVVTVMIALHYRCAAVHNGKKDTMPERRYIAEFMVVKVMTGANH